MSGVLILGASRSGTSMTAGLFVQHGVWFGDCVPPARMNAKGFFESEALRRVYMGQEAPADFPAWWAAQREREGWAGEVWGAKGGAERWEQFWRAVPDIAAVVHCYRDRESIEASRARVGFNASRQTVSRNWALMQKMREGGGPPCFPVWTPRFIDGDFHEVRPAFRVLGIEFDDEIAREWVDPGLWHHRGS